MMSDQAIEALDHELRAACRRHVRVEAARIPRPPAGVIALAAVIAICAAVALPVLSARPRTLQYAGGSAPPQARSALARAAAAAGAGTAAPALHGSQAWDTTAVFQDTVRLLSPRHNKLLLEHPHELTTWITRRGVATVRPQGLRWNPPGFSNWTAGPFAVDHFPTTPAGVLSRLDSKAWVQFHHPYTPPSARAYKTPFAKLAEISVLLGVEPLLPAARAAAFDAIARLPGLRYLGTARDSLGRTGIAVAEQTTRFGPSGFPSAQRYQFELIFDPARGVVLGWRSTVAAPVPMPTLGLKPGLVLFSWAYRSSHLVQKVQLPTPFGPARRQITAIPAAEAAHFAIFRRPLTPSDHLPSGRADPFANAHSLVVGRIGANPALGRRVVTSQGNVWVIPGNGAICLWNGGGGCASVAASIAGKNLSWTSNSAGGTLIDGLAPDGVTRVAILLANGSVDEVAVHDNVYAASTPSPMKSIRLGGPHGKLVLRGGPGF